MSNNQTTSSSEESHPDNLTVNSLHTGEVTLKYAAGPQSGPPLVFLHGGSTRWQEFDSIIPAFTDKWHVLAPDLRGHGKSGRTPDRYRLKDYAGDIRVFLEQTCTEPAVLYGHSLGGMVALMVAALVPDKVRAVLVGDSPLSVDSWRKVIDQDRDRLIFWRDIAGQPVDSIITALMDYPIRWTGFDGPVPAKEALGEDCPWFARMAENLHYQDPGMLTVLLDNFDQAAEGYEPEEMLPRIRAEVLLLQADPKAGGLMQSEEIDRALALLSRATHVMFKHIGHGLHTQNRDPVLFIIKDYLDNLK